MAQTYQQSVMAAWMQVNQVTASLDMTGAASAFRRAVATTDFRSLSPTWEIDDFKVYALDSLEGQLVYVDRAGEILVVGTHLWNVLQSDYNVVESFVQDMMNGASGVKVINTDSGPYRAAGQAWREMTRDDDVLPAPEALGEVEQRMQALLQRLHVLRAVPDLSTEQYQQVYSDLTTVSETLQTLQDRLEGLQETYAVVQAAVAAL